MLARNRWRPPRFRKSMPVCSRKMRNIWRCFCGDAWTRLRFSMQMIALFALTALLLAGLGIYGVISYIVSERTHEIGIQLALGAQRGRIIQMVLRQGLTLAIAGAAVGLVGALIVSHLMAGLLYGVSPTDPLTFAIVAVLLT